MTVASSIGVYRSTLLTYSETFILNQAEALPTVVPWYYGHRRIAGLGPDILAEPFDEQLALRRLREDDPTRTIGDALLDQRTVAGIGNIWK